MKGTGSAAVFGGIWCARIGKLYETPPVHVHVHVPVVYRNTFIYCFFGCLAVSRRRCSRRSLCSQRKKGWDVFFQEAGHHMRNFHPLFSCALVSCISQNGVRGERRTASKHFSVRGQAAPERPVCLFCGRIHRFVVRPLLPNTGEKMFSLDRSKTIEPQHRESPGDGNITCTVGGVFYF